MNTSSIELWALRRLLVKAYRKIMPGTGKGRACYVVAKKLAVLVPAIMWKVENVPNELGE